MKKQSMCLDWPEEVCTGDTRYLRWSQPASNICLDFHGDPVNARLVVFSDGNHHMALRDCLDLFVRQNRDLSGVFYATTPPGPIATLLRQGGLRLGNLVLRVSPHVFISPPEVLDGLAADGLMAEHCPFAQNRGNVLLIHKGNPKNICSVSDLVRNDIRLFLSNPQTEKGSFTAYYNTLKNLVSGGDPRNSFPDDKIARGRILFGKCIHHREAPQAVAEGSADAAVVFYHLALRYIRIFPDHFKMIPLGGSVDNPEPLPGNVIGRINMGLVGDGGAWGRRLISFLRSRQASEIYVYHGLHPLSPVDPPP
ncbi:MAG: substrate-binding domain-containing protein [Deltaproteobacteria bacterium]|jgi:hypothetical protein|nr:substrate-binding domain-containing protein [Deltaproteobacteria bacterium]